MIPYSRIPVVVTVEWADLEIVDLSKAMTPEGRAELAPRVRDIMRTTGFMYVVNHGITQTQVRAPSRVEVFFPLMPSEDRTYLQHRERPFHPGA